MKRNLRFIFLSVAILVLLAGITAFTGTRQGLITGGLSAISEKIGIAGDQEALRLPPEELVAWVEDAENGMVQEHEIGNYIFTALYKPVSYSIVKDLLRHGGVNQKSYMRALKEYDGFYYFTYRIARKGNDSKEFLKADLSSEQDYYNRVEYFSFRMQQLLSLTVDGKELPCVLYHFERAYNVSPFITVVVGFQADKGMPAKPQDDLVISYDDKILGVGKVNIAIPAKAVQAIPTIEIEKEL